MTRRRAFTLLAAALLAVACRGGGREATVAGVRVVDVRTQGADASAPLVVWLHGRGGTPERFVDWWTRFPARAEVVLPQGLAPWGRGYAWFPSDASMSLDELAAAIGAAEERLWPALAEIAHGRKLVVAGFSQGAELAWLIAARHPDAVAGSIPVAGGLPDPLWPRAGAPAAPVYALHGTADDVLGVDYDRATARAFRAAGGVVELREYPGVDHTLTDAMRAEVFARAQVELSVPTAPRTSR